eukprot:gb/GECG01009226.1/.p1 GENE.gb/GECG01009226.1/~~gb/GECG01009226.1/.p1  ORF type:complete len:121 (+),score=17.96 gb/GECG01009226.1/:1-363(+)
MSNHNILPRGELVSAHAPVPMNNSRWTLLQLEKEVMPDQDCEIGGGFTGVLFHGGILILLGILVVVVTVFVLIQPQQKIATKKEPHVTSIQKRHRRVPTTYEGSTVDGKQEVRKKENGTS